MKLIIEATMIDCVNTFLELYMHLLLKHVAERHMHSFKVISVDHNALGCPQASGC